MVPAIDAAATDPPVITGLEITVLVSWPMLLAAAAAFDAPPAATCCGTVFSCESCAMTAERVSRTPVKSERMVWLLAPDWVAASAEVGSVAAQRNAKAKIAEYVRRFTQPIIAQG
jgi:hypothetical protein